MSSCRELEFSCSIQITNAIYSKLSKKKFTKSVGAEKILKIICHDNLRILIDDESSQYQLKTAQYRKEDLFYFWGFFLSSRLTLSTETNIDAISTDIGTLIDCYGTDAAADKRIITRIERYYFFDAATNIRHSIEYDTSLDIYRYNFEYEFDNSSVHEMNDTDLLNWVKCNYTSMFNHFKALCKESITLYDILEIVFDSKCTIMDILKLDCDLSRPFSNKKNTDVNNTQLPVYYAPKLDGIKHFCILNGYTLQLLYENKFVNFTPVFKQPEQQEQQQHHAVNKFRTMFKQTIIGNVEIVNDKMYLIDILYVLNSVGIYTKIKHYDAVLILNKLKHNLSILVDKKNDLSAATTTTTTEEEYIEINDYSTDLNFIKSIIEKNPKNYDGWLEINENCIVKKKTYDTIDLLLAQNRTLKKKLNVEKMLRFMHGEFFYKTGYKLGEFNMRLVDQRDNTRQFYIFEFTVNTVLKRIDFLRARTDKSVPNTLKCFNEMINNNSCIKDVIN